MTEKILNSEKLEETQLNKVSGGVKIKLTHTKKIKSAANKTPKD